MAATTLFSSPIALSIQHHSNKFRQPSTSSAAQSTSNLSKPTLFLRRASSSSTVDKQEEDEEQTSSDESEPIASIPFGACKACGKSEIERGCNGEGRMQGGIATVPGFGWWPIKAYRPCPGFVATGGRYRRQGQTMDEVAGFGSVPIISSKVTTAGDGTGEAQTSEKKEGPRKFKR